MIKIWLYILALVKWKKKKPGIAGFTGGDGPIIKKKEMDLIYCDKVKTDRGQFCKKVRDVADKLDIDPNWLMWVMHFESGLDHRAVNPYTNATGLIQFMPATARGLGTNTVSLLQMDNLRQLDYVYLYLKPYRKKMKSMVDVYFAVFFPAAMNKPDGYILQTSRLSASKIAAQNPVHDLDKDGQITRNEVEAKISAGVPYEYIEIMKKKRV